MIQGPNAPTNRSAFSASHQPISLCLCAWQSECQKTQLRSSASNTDSLMAEPDHLLKTALASTTIPPPFSSSGAWRLDQTTGSSAVNDQMNHLAKGGHIDTVAIVPPAHPWSSLLQGGTFKISDPSHDNGSSRKSPSFFVAVITHKMGTCWYRNF